MLFNSLQFIFFFPIVTALYFILPHRYRWFMLLLASCYFYMAFIPVYILILFVTIIIDYFAGLLLERTTEQGKRKLLLIIGLIVNVAFLAFFKYYNFFIGNITYAANLFHWNIPIPVLSIILPIGLSFHTFQAMAYIIEVYRGGQKAEHNFGIFALYVMFYPQLVAGPIERPQNLLHQFYEKHEFDPSRVADGLKLMLWGFFKKIVIADRLAPVVSLVYTNPSQFDSWGLIIATVMFAVQIYCDFSGYSDIAIGAAQVMGFTFMDNFKRPYYSKSISEFWRRWHISLSSWFKDYLYIPLGGSRVPVRQIYLNLFIVFTVSGLWHGANWTYIIWGMLHGFYLVFGQATRMVRMRIAEALRLTVYPQIFKFIQVSIVCCLVTFAWIFFRANNLTDAWYIVTHLFTSLDLHALPKTISSLGMTRNEWFIALGAVVFLEYIHLIQRHGSIRHMLSEHPRWVRWSLCYIMILAILLFGNYENQQFIYFQF